MVSLSNNERARSSFDRLRTMGCVNSSAPGLLQRFSHVRRRRASARRSAGLKAGRYTDVKRALATSDLFQLLEMMNLVTGHLFDDPVHGERAVLGVLQRNGAIGG